MNIAAVNQTPHQIYDRIESFCYKNPLLCMIPIVGICFEAIAHEGLKKEFNLAQTDQRRIEVIQIDNTKHKLYTLVRNIIELITSPFLGLISPLAAIIIPVGVALWATLNIVKIIKQNRLILEIQTRGFVPLYNQICVEHEQDGLPRPRHSIVLA